MAIEIHGRITASGVRSFLLKIHKYVARSRHQLIRRPTILIASLQDADLVYYSFKNVSISSKKKERLVYRVISQMASSLSQIHVACSTMKMSSFPLEIVKNIQAMKSYRFLQ